MSNKSKEQKANYEELVKQRMEQIRSLSPELVNSDGLLDVAVLKEWLGEKNVAPLNQGYQLNFAGKGLARLNADLPTDKELKVEGKQSKDFDTTQNVIIRGDNLDVLKVLRKSYEDKVNMIYIDPPYNTDSANFIYNDSFKESEEDLIGKYGLPEEAINFFDNVFGTLNHSGWLFAMYPRLKLAHSLLTDDGVIFISIDDNEQTNLKIMCDEIFGNNNFVANIVWTNKEGGGGSDSSLYKIKHEYILCYSKSKKNTHLNGVVVEEDETYNKEDKHVKERGRYKLIKLSSTSLRYAETLDYPIECPDGSVVKPNKGKEKIASWRWNKEKLNWGIKNDFVEFSKKRDGEWVVYTKQYHKVDNDNNPIVRTLPPNALIDQYSSTMATKQMEKIFGRRKVFDYSKPFLLIKELLKASTSKEDIILDFFAGSGTTAQAVMNINKEDEGNRKFVLVQWDEAIDPKASKSAYDFCIENNLAPVISSICIERARRVGESIKQEAGTSGKDLDIGYKVFSLTEQPKRITENKQLQIASGRETALDTLYNMIAASGQALLTDTIEEIEPNLLYKVNNAHYVLGEYKGDLKNTGMVFVDGYADISLERWLNMVGLDKENIKILY